ncbi:MAG: phenylalanine--tRNA ligase beta subunit-related protein [Actinomycetota bacterium]|nr:phenylalanine--tRNA ligase beta subunit-related protein [Actinomycetota bacterium]
MADGTRAQATTDRCGFGYANDVLERFPTIRAGVVHVDGVHNGSSPPALRERYRATQEDVGHRLATTPIAEHPSISAWRRVFSAFGAKPTQYRNAAEALLRRLSKQGDIPSISLLVDIGNLVSIRHAVPVAVLDVAAVDGEVTVRFATGSERFADLRSDGEERPEPGEVVFVDEAGVVSARRWCWRQSAVTATSPTTTGALFVVEAHHDGAADDVAAAADEIGQLLASLEPSAVTTTAQLSPAAPRWHC